MRIALALVALTLVMPAYGSACRARSEPHTTALVELYTSEGCSSCPPADQWLSALGQNRPVAEVVPLALHVDYWDYIGWKDPYAKREFSQRQRRLSQLQRAAFVYTPQVMLQGRDFRAWGSSAFDQALARINAQPARAAIELEIVSASAEAFRLHVAASVSDRALAPQATLYVAAYENRLQSLVSAGENLGRTLRHDHVALEWQGPYPLGEREVVLPLLPRGKAADSGVVAFVQNRATAEVLQVVSLGFCTP
ncbi:MAG: DUF1223 domain-containing protein [Burkholderiales bacterium]